MNHKKQIKKVHKAGARTLRIEAKRHVELWIYSFADMYMILVFFFIAMSAIYALKAKNDPESLAKLIPSVGRGIASSSMTANIEFSKESVEISQAELAKLRPLLPYIVKNEKAMIEIEGYAENEVRAESIYKSNLELSNLRAVRVAEWLINLGINPKQIRTYSYGSAHTFEKTELKNNKRVVIKVFNKMGIVGEENEGS